MIYTIEREIDLAPEERLRNNFLFHTKNMRNAMRDRERRRERERMSERGTAISVAQCDRSRRRADNSFL